MARRQEIINYIKENGPVKSSAVCRDLGMSRSSLSDDVRAINTAGEIIVSPKRGYYVLGESPQKAPAPYVKIDLKAVRRWLILFALRSGDLPFDEICGYLDENGITYTEATLYKDLAELQQEGLVSRLSVGQSRLYHSVNICETDRREIRQFQDRRKRQNARIDITAMQDIDLKIKHCVPPGEDFPAQRNAVEDVHETSGGPSLSFRTAGKKNILTEEQLKILGDFEKYPFAEKKLAVIYRTAAGRELERTVQTGLIVYVVETSRIYLMGKDRDLRYLVIPMESILSVRESEGTNTCYNAPEFHKIYREMFQISTEDPVHVRVRFQNLSFVREKVDRLCKVRPNAKLEVRENELIYTDTIRGVADFARYLRRFGKSAIVEEPKILRDQMILTARKVLDIYEEKVSDQEDRKDQESQEVRKDRR